MTVYGIIIFTFQCTHQIQLNITKHWAVSSRYRMNDNEETTKSTTNANHAGHIIHRCCYNEETIFRYYAKKSVFGLFYQTKLINWGC